MTFDLKQLCLVTPVQPLQVEMISSTCHFVNNFREGISYLTFPNHDIIGLLSLDLRLFP